jgi:hypothetical protein
MRLIFAFLPAPVVPDAATTTMSVISINPIAGANPREIEVA